MPRSLSLWVAVLLGGGAIYAGCTQNFDQFAPDQSGVGGGASGAGGNGNGTLSSTGASMSTSSSATTTGTGSSSSVGSTSASSTAASSTAASSTAASSSSGGVEMDCTNHVDDDGNGQVDCADAACQSSGYLCVTKANGGWMGPVILFEGDPANAPSCPADYPTQDYQGFDNLTPEDAVCSACTCDPPNVTCVLKPITAFSDASCTTSIGVAAAGQPGQCTSFVPPQMAPGSLKSEAPTAVGGACAAPPVQVTIPPPNWGTTAILCGGEATGSGCGNKTCVAGSPPPFQAKRCVWQSGDVQCPNNSVYSAKHLYFDGVLDSRGCTPCTCGGATATCSATTDFFASGACANPSDLSFPQDGACHASPGLAGDKGAKTNVTKSGSCPPGGGQPTGSITESPAQTTVCCVP